MGLPQRKLVFQRLILAGYAEFVPFQLLQEYPLRPAVSASNDAWCCNRIINMEMFEVLLLAGWLIKNAATAINNCHLETQTLSTYIYI